MAPLVPVPLLNAPSLLRLDSFVSLALIQRKALKDEISKV